MFNWKLLVLQGYAAEAWQPAQERRENVGIPLIMSAVMWSPFLFFPFLSFYKILVQFLQSLLTMQKPFDFKFVNLPLICFIGQLNVFLILYIHKL